MQNSFTRKRNSGWNENEESSKKKQKLDDLPSFINLQNKEGESPLHIAVANKNIEECKFFLEKGANANLQNCEGKTTLHVAAQQKNLEIIQLLLSHGADANICDSKGNTVLHLAPGLEISKLVIEHMNEKQSNLSTRGNKAISLMSRTVMVANSSEAIVDVYGGKKYLDAQQHD